MNLSISKQLTQLLDNAVTNAGYNIGSSNINLEHPVDLAHGDYACNIALQLAGQFSKSPVSLATDIVRNVATSDIVDKISIAGAGYINITLNQVALTHEVDAIIESGDRYGASILQEGERIMYEYTDPNPFKVFHIGHLMSNTIGEALARLSEWSGAQVTRANYQGDVGLHVAKAIYGMRLLLDKMPSDSATLTEKTSWLGESYVVGAKYYAESAKEEIEVLNKIIFEKSDDEVNRLYDIGFRWSQEHFEQLYQTLGTRFDDNARYLESQVAKDGLDIVRAGEKEGIFEKSDGAVIFDGERHGLHKRVFITSQGLPTYECKELGLNVRKFREHKIDKSIIITGNEIVEYMKVVMKVFEAVAPDVSSRTRHIPHGMMLGPSGKKMSSRKGDVISGEGLIEEMKELAKKKVREARPDTSELEIETIATHVAVVAIKYSILKQAIGKNIIFDREQALSFDGDSGPYLLYTYARARSILRKAEEAGISLDVSFPKNWQTTELERRLYWLPEVIERAARESAPSHVATYLIQLAQTFNSYYGNTQIIQSDDSETRYRLALTTATTQVIKNGLNVLGAETVERM